MSWRTQIAQALDGIEGVTGYPVAPSPASPGDGWPIWVSAAPFTGCGLLEQWRVVVVLPSVLLAESIDASEPLIGDVFTALLELGEVSLIEPWAMPVTAADAAMGRAAAQPVPTIRWSLSTLGTGE